MRICVLKFRSKFIYCDFAFLRRTNNQSLTIMNIFQSNAFMISRAGGGVVSHNDTDRYGFLSSSIIEGGINYVRPFNVKNTRA